VFQEIKSNGSLFLYFSPTAYLYCSKMLESYRAVARDEPYEPTNQLFGLLATQVSNYIAVISSNWLKHHLG